MTRQKLAAIGALGHAPGLWLFARYKLDPVTARWNVVAAVGTLAAMAGGAVVHGGLGLFAAWVVGHFAWSAVLAWRLLRRT